MDASCLGEVAVGFHEVPVWPEDVEPLCHIHAIACTDEHKVCLLHGFPCTLHALCERAVIAIAHPALSFPICFLVLECSRRLLNAMYSY